MLRAAAIILTAVLAAAPPVSAQDHAAPGAFDYYLLTLSWSPTYCAAHREAAAREECASRRGFIVHGLWPQDENGRWPEFCRTVPTVPPAIVEHERTVMPNAAMIEHEWERHGSCTRFSANGYFDQLDHAFAGFRIPDPLAHPPQPVSLPLDRAKTLFADANPGLASGMMALRCHADGTVEELRVCLDTDLRFRPCGAGQADACPAAVRFPAIPAADAP
jgi:ribonuclease T2